ncbi:putative Glycosyl hydrolase (plasmid) [Streptantibioticus cattleyicolor NRRL 8057 = DSM 46488]|nr:putative Glycosyl hydrolase [Streptantibioticus cattleyicolor NRRL 8057 = DSM 46488]
MGRWDVDATRNGMWPRRGVLTAAGALAAGAVTGGGRARAAVRGLTGTAVLSPRQRAGQRVVYSYPGPTPPASLLRAISAGECAGVVFFGENISDEAQIASVIGQLRQANAAGPVGAPLLLMTDQEGGEVRRLPGAPVPSEKRIGQSADPAGQAANAGTGAGRNLAGVGMNVNLAPVLDVFREPGDFIDEYQRSYSDDPAVVAECAAAFVTAQQATGVAATAKHFPGLGAATRAQDTDTGPVTLTLSRSELRTVDEAPYAAAIGAQVRLVMVSWAVYPALDPRWPAGLSSTVVQGELRGRLGFTGVTVTDALEAGALPGGYDTGRRAVLAADAGMDLLLCSARDTGQCDAAVTALAAAYTGGRLDPVAFDAAVQRVGALRAALS